MPIVSPGNVLAILLADIHLSLEAPLWRSVESDWLSTQRLVLEQINVLQKLCICPILCAGDIFNWWDCKAELINFALAYLPSNIYCIPGQHDLPNHRLKDIKRSAFWTLVKSKKIKYVRWNLPWATDNGVRIYGFPFGTKIQPCPSYKKTGTIHVALIHDYVWIEGHSFKTAPKEKRLGNKRALFKDSEWNGYDFVVYGDNHSAFEVTQGKTTFWNCGTLIKRLKDEKNYTPRVGLLMKDGTIFNHYLDCSQDKYLPIELTDKQEKYLNEDVNLETLFNELQKLGFDKEEFRNLIKRYCNNRHLPSEVLTIIENAMEKRK